MQGYSVTLLWLDEELELLCTAACDAPALRRGATFATEVATDALDHNDSLPSFSEASGRSKAGEMHSQPDRGDRARVEGRGNEPGRIDQGNEARLCCRVRSRKGRGSGRRRCCKRAGLRDIPGPVLEDPRRWPRDRSRNPNRRARHLHLRLHKLQTFRGVARIDAEGLFERGVRTTAPRATGSYGFESGALLGRRRSTREQDGARDLGFSCRRRRVSAKLVEMVSSVAPIANAIRHRAGRW